MGRYAQSRHRGTSGAEPLFPLGPPVYDAAFAHNWRVTTEEAVWIVQAGDDPGLHGIEFAGQAGDVPGVSPVAPTWTGVIIRVNQPDQLDTDLLSAATATFWARWVDDSLAPLSSWFRHVATP